MICPPCREAPKLVKETEIIFQDLHTGNQKMVTGTQMAEMLHGNCEFGATCTCQHVVQPPRVGLST